MIDWFSHPQAEYVIAAYGVALIALVGFALLSWCSARAREHAWQRVKEQRQEP